MSDYEYEREQHHHHHHHKRGDSPSREDYVVDEVVYERPPPRRDDYVVEEVVYGRPPPREEEYGAYPPRRDDYVYERPPAPPSDAAGPYGPPAPGPYVSSSYGEGYRAPQGLYGSYGNYCPPGAATTTDYYQKQELEAGEYERAKLEEGRHKREEEVAGVGVLAAGAFAMYEGRRAKTDPDHSGRHKLDEEIAAGLGVGAGSYALYEHHKKEESQHEVEAWKREREELEGHKKHHGWFS